MNLIDQLAQRIVAGPPAQAVDDTSDGMSVHVLDTVGAWLAGRVTREGRELYGLRGSTGTVPTLFDPSLLDTVALMTSSARLTEVDDVHMPSCTTPGAVVVLSALAIAASPLPASRSSERLLPAIHTGYELMTRLGEAVSGPEILHRGVWPTLLLTPVTVAAVISTLLGLDEDRTAHALAIALTASNGRPGGSASAGVTSGQGTSARWLLLGMAARTGCMAAMSAAAGFIGDRGILENAQASPLQGIPLDREVAAALFRDGLGVTRTSIKPFCSAKHNIAAIDGFRRMLEAGISHEPLTRIEVRLPPLHAAMVAHHDVTTSRLARITSCSYNLALAAVRPDDLLDIERLEPVRSEALSRLAGKVEVVADAQLEAATPQAYPATIVLYQGSDIVASQTFLHAHGDAELPFTLDDARHKFRRLTRDTLASAPALEIEDLCTQLASRPQIGRALWKALSAIDLEGGGQPGGASDEQPQELDPRDHPGANPSTPGSVASTSPTP